MSDAIDRHRQRRAEILGDDDLLFGAAATDAATKAATAGIAVSALSELAKSASGIADQQMRRQDDERAAAVTAAKSAAAKSERDAATDARAVADSAAQQARALAARAKARPGDPAARARALTAAQKAADLELEARRLEARAGILSPQQQAALAKSVKKPSFFAKIPWYGWLGIGLGAVGVGVGGYFIFKGKKK